MAGKLGGLIRTAAVLLALLAIVGCASMGRGQYDAYIAKLPPAGPEPTMEQAQASAQDWLNKSLKDPYSAVYDWGSIEKGTFRGAFERWGTPGWIFTVGVNGKNSYGGYTGMKPYKFIFRSGYLVEVYSFDTRTNGYVAAIGMRGQIIPPPTQ